jgi:hypothetical protein
MAALNFPSYDYDLDSLVYLAGGIVEGRLVGPSRLRITAVHAGSLRVGDTVTVKVGDEYLRSAMSSTGSGFPLEAGDGVFVFYDQPRLAPAAGTGAQISLITPIHGGIKLVTRGRVHGCGQEDNPGPFYTTADVATVAEYRAAIKASMAKAVGWHARLDGPADQKDIPWLLGLLKERYTPLRRNDSGRDQDAIADAACDRLQELHSPKLLDQGLLANPRAWQLFDGFSTPEGREFLLRGVGDTAMPKAHRLMLAKAIGYSVVGGVYNARSNRLATRPWQPPETADPKNSSYFTRIARLAASMSSDDADLANILLTAIKTHAGFSPGERDPQIQADLDDAAGVLRA